MRNFIVNLCMCVMLLFVGANAHIVLAGHPNVTVGEGNAMLLSNVQGIDMVYIFADLDKASLQKHAQHYNPVWWKIQNGDSTCFATGVDYLFPENNTGYILHTDSGDMANPKHCRTVFWVLDYSQYKPAFRSLQVDSTQTDFCEETRLILDADILRMAYQTQYGSEQEINRTCRLTYQSLAWNGEAWSDSLCVEEARLRKTIVVGAPLQNTSFTLHNDQFAQELGLPVDSIVSDEFEAIAVDARPTTITTTRGTGDPLDLSNEVERPIEESQLAGSAPLDIYFKANATPAGKYYSWKIYKGERDLIVQRTDAEQRYTFDKTGVYRVVMCVSNDSCTTDSVEVKVTASASQLLVPNVFTPNGDGKNDEFRVMYRSITEFHCWIYNRWGKLVYEWTDPAKGWDGTINGRPAAESAYFYVIRAVGADRIEGEEIGIYELKGDINLIRGGKK